MTTLPPEIRSRRETVESLCQRFGVGSLFLFGSKARGDSSSESDLDFAVVYADLPDGLDAFARYFGLKESLEDLFNRPVDLVEWRAVRNPWLKREVEREWVRIVG